jgi:hypothetical protein
MVLTWSWLNDVQELQDCVAKGKGSNEQMMQIQKDVVDFHGEMVLLQNYSSINYTGNFICFFVP